MEVQVADEVRRFLAVSHGSGYGDGSGSGYGDGYGIKSIDGHAVHVIDGVQTVILRVHANYARGYILGRDLTLEPCYIAKVGDSFAHGETLRAALEAAEAKALEDMPVEERIARFKEAHPDLYTPYGDLFKWHHILTGSCEMGRKQWCREHGYQPEDSITVGTFIRETLNDYGGEVIRQLAEAYGYPLTCENTRR